MEKSRERNRKMDAVGVLQALESDCAYFQVFFYLKTVDDESVCGCTIEIVEKIAAKNDNVTANFFCLNL
jgi:hypothetical protein